MDDGDNSRCNVTDAFFSLFLFSPWNYVWFGNKPGAGDAAVAGRRGGGLGGARQSAGAARRQCADAAVLRRAAPEAPESRHDRDGGGSARRSGRRARVRRRAPRRQMGRRRPRRDLPQVADARLQLSRATEGLEGHLLPCGRVSNLLNSPRSSFYRCCRVNLWPVFRCVFLDARLPRVLT